MADFHDLPEQPHLAVTFVPGGVLVTYLDRWKDSEDPDERVFFTKTVTMASWGSLQEIADHAAGVWAAAMFAWASRDRGEPGLSSGYTPGKVVELKPHRGKKSPKRDSNGEL